MRANEHDATAALAEEAWQRHLMDEALKPFDTIWPQVGGSIEDKGFALVERFGLLLLIALPVAIFLGL